MQQQQPDPRLLEGLPAPALRLVAQHISIPSTPGVCRLSSVSSALRQAAADLPVNFKVSYSRFACVHFDSLDATMEDLQAYHQSLLAWLRRYAHCVEGLTLVSGDTTEVQPHEVLSALASVTAAAAAATDGALPGSSGAGRHGTASGAAPDGEAAAGSSSLATPGRGLQRMHLESIWVSRPLASLIARFDRLQVLAMTDIRHYEPHMQRALPQLQQLQKLALHGAVISLGVEAEPLLRVLPVGLRALDLELHSSPCSSSSLARLVHLTSLRVDGFQLECQTCSSEGQQDEQQQQQQPAVGALRVLSMRPTSATSWFAPSSLETLELIGSMGATYASPMTVNLTQLGACRRLRHLNVLYDGCMPEAFGLSALTQLTYLRLVSKGPPPVDTSRRVHLYSSSDSSSSSSSSSDSDSSSSYYGSPRCRSSSIGSELAFLRQLRVLEVGSCILSATQPQHSWLPQLHHLTQLVVLVGMERDWCPGPLHQLAEVISAWHDSSSASSTAGTVLHPAPGGSGGSSGEGLQARPCKLRCVKLVLLVQHVGGWSGCSWGGLQEVAADMAAALPWLQVVCEDDCYACPCWTVESEVQPG